jgi:hypothetical protein
MLRNSRYQIIVVFVVALAALAIGWQTPGPLDINVGAGEDRFLSHAYPIERAGERDYRWVRGQAGSQIALLGLGWNDWQIKLVAATAQRPDGPPHIRVLAHGHVVFETTAANPDYVEYTFIVSGADTSLGDLLLDLDVPEFRAPGDGRDLGLAIDRLELTPRGLVVPAMVLWLALAAAITLIYAGLSLFSIPLALVGTLAAILATGYATTAERLTLATFAPAVFAYAGLTLVLSFTFRGALARVRPRTEGVVYRSAPPKNSYWKWPVLVLVLAGTAFITAHMISIASQPIPYDFTNYYVAGERLLQERPLYDLYALYEDKYEGPFLVYKYPPLFALGMKPLAALPLVTAFQIWTILNLFLLGISIYALVRTHERGPTPYTLATILFVALALLFQPNIDTLSYGQADIAVLALVALCYSTWRAGKEVWSGALLALATLVKLYPGLILLHFIVKREWRVVVAFAATLALLVAASLPFTGSEPWWTFLTQVLPRSGGSTVWIENQTFVAFLGRFLTDRIRLEELSADPSFPAGLVTIAGLIWAAVVLGVSIWLARHRSDRRSPASALSFALFTAASVVALPVAWHHYATLMLVPLAIILFTIEQRGGAWFGSSPAAFIASVALFTLAVVLLTFGSYDLAWDSSKPAVWRNLLVSYKFYGMFALWAVSAWLLSREVAQTRQLRSDML